MPKRFYQGENDNLEYTFDFQRWLAEGETISTASLSADTGLTIGSETIGSTAVNVFASGGSAEQEYAITCTINTNLGQTKEAKIYISILPY